MKYTEEDFQTLIRKSYNYSQKEQDTSKGWALFRELYEKNYIKEEDMTPKIPKITHHIWLGGELPDKFKRYVHSWYSLHPTWEHRFWTDDNIDSITLGRKDVFNAATNLGQKSDILRYEILRQQGGVYIDTDFECIKPIDDLLFLEFFTGITTDADAQLYIGILGSVPNHPIMDTCATSLKSYSGNDGNGVMEATGPFYFTRCFFNSVDKNTKGVVAFPMDFFYPFPNSQRFTDDANKYINKCTYAIHHWKTSWLYK